MDFTDWHRLFGITLTDFFTDTAYIVELEKDLSLKKQFLDVVIIEKKEGCMPEEVPDGFESLAKHNLLSYKSFRESFDDWSADELIGHFVNYRKQVSPSLNRLLPKNDFGLYAVCTRFPEKLAKQTDLIRIKEGVYDFRWGIRNIRLIVTSHISKEKQNAMWLMFSAIAESVKYGVSSYRGRLNEMSSTIERLLVRYETERIIDMPYTIEDFRNEMKQRALKFLTAEEILAGFSQDELLKRIPPEKRLRGLLPEERLRGLPAEERLRGLSPEEIKAYLKKLTKKTMPAKKKRAKAEKSESG